MSEVTAVLKWEFSPPGYFEQSIKMDRSDYTMVVDNGKAEARVSSAAYEASPDLRAILYQALDDRFRVRQLRTFKPYELSKSSMSREYPCGRIDCDVEVKGNQINLSVGTADIRTCDEGSKVVTDSREERIAADEKRWEIVSQYWQTDVLLRSLFNSWEDAVQHPSTELVHLYQIREALGVKFSGEKPTRLKLGVSASDWSRLGRLCNDEPFRQGRHVGKNADALRDATEGELTEARAIARAMIEAYLLHLEKCATASAT